MLPGRSSALSSYPHLADENCGGLNDRLLAGKVGQLLSRLRKIQASVSRRGPNTKKKREGLQKLIEYYESRQEMMQYDKYCRDDLVLATGVIEGACRYVVGERLDCSGMRWTLAGAEPLLQLRCIELNGDWSSFSSWLSEQTTAELHHGTLVRLRSPKPESESVPHKKRAA